MMAKKLPSQRSEKDSLPEPGQRPPGRSSKVERSGQSAAPVTNTRRCSPVAHALPDGYRARGMAAIKSWGRIAVDVRAGYCDGVWPGLECSLCTRLLVIPSHPLRRRPELTLSIGSRL